MLLHLETAGGAKSLEMPIPTKYCFKLVKIYTDIFLHTFYINYYRALYEIFQETIKGTWGAGFVSKQCPSDVKRI